MYNFLYGHSTPIKFYKYIFCHNPHLYSKDGARQICPFSCESQGMDHLVVESGNLILVHNGERVKYHSKFITRQL